MYLRFLKTIILILIPLTLLSACSKTTQAVIAEKQYIEPPRQQKIPSSKTSLRVCADPNNLPFSNKNGDGFENKIAGLIAKDMNLPIEYTWWAQRRGFFRSTLKAGVCDVVIGVPSGFEMAATTEPYYRSSYVFVSRRDRSLNIASLDDPQLKSLKIGVEMIGDDGISTPPAHALANRGIIKNVVGYTVYGDYRQDSPPKRIVEAVANANVDLAIVWGPLGGYYAKKQHVPMQVRPVSPQIDLPYLPFVYDISIGVRRGEDDLKVQLQDVLNRRHNDVEKILDDYGVPRISLQHPNGPDLSKEGK
jgi:mxaJ protein